MPRPPTPNILLIVWDTVRHDRCVPATTPRLQARAPELARFERALAPSPWTVPSVASQFTGLYPTEHGAVRTTSALPPDAPLLAELLAAAGFRTAGFSQNPLVGPAGGFARGCERFLTHDVLCGPFAASRNPVARLRARAARARTVPTRRTVDAVLEWIDTGDGRPFFAFLDLMDAHWPLRPPRAFRPAGAPRRTPDGETLLSYTAIAERVPAERVAAWRRLYDAAIAHLDAETGRLLDGLAARARLDDTLVIIVSDHGECYGEHGLFGHMFLLYEQLVRVPLLVRFPGRAHGGTTSGVPVEILDVFATALATAGVRVPANTRGIGLLESMHRGDSSRPLFAESHGLEPALRERLRRANPRYDASRLAQTRRCLRAANWKLIVNDGGVDELYDLATDPDERHDLAAAHPTELARLRAALAEVVRSLRTAAASPDADLDASLASQMARLGYLPE
jgi:arylsulfatase A-like enzyme